MADHALQSLPFREAVARIRRELEAGFRHAFVVTQNVRDLVWLDDGNILNFPVALCCELSRGNFDKHRVVARYSVSQGITLYRNGQRIGDRSDDVARQFATLTGLEDMLVFDVKTAQQLRARIRRPADVLPQMYLFLRATDWRSSLVIDSAEYLVESRGAGGTGALEDRAVLDVLLNWARDRYMAADQRGIILLCPEVGRIPADIIRGDAVFSVIPSPYPNQEQRLSFLVFQGVRQDQAQVLANLTTGFTLRDLREMASLASEPDIATRIIQRKAQMIRARCGDTIELVESPFGLDTSNAQPRVRDYLRVLAQIILTNRKSPLVPMGLLFIGVPGNGKSHMARAFAHDCGMNMLRFKNVRSMWVGESERNLETVLDLLPSLAPCVVFVDEIDQMLSARIGGRAGNGGAGVEARLLGRLLDFMGDPAHRGDILWIGATNRPDLLDVAMLRRFDRVLPFMNPTEDARKGLISDLLQCLSIPSDDCFNPEQVAAQMTDFTCDDVEKVIRRAYEIAAGEGHQQISNQHIESALRLYKRNYDPHIHELVALLSIQASNFLSDLPWYDQAGNLVEKPPDQFKDIVTDSGIDVEALSQRIGRLRTQLSGREVGLREARPAIAPSD